MYADGIYDLFHQVRGAGAGAVVEMKQMWGRIINRKTESNLKEGAMVLPQGHAKQLLQAKNVFPNSEVIWTLPVPDIYC